MAADIAVGVALDAEPLEGTVSVRQGELALAMALQLEHAPLTQRHKADSADRLFFTDLLLAGPFSF